LGQTGIPAPPDAPKVIGGRVEKDSKKGTRTGELILPEPKKDFKKPN